MGVDISDMQFLTLLSSWQMGMFATKGTCQMEKEKLVNVMNNKVIFSHITRYLTHKNKWWKV